MGESPAPRHTDRQSTWQLARHWLVVFLVTVQLLFNDGMSRAYESGLRTGELPAGEGGEVPMRSRGSPS